MEWAFLSAHSIYLSDVISIDKEVLSAKLSLKLTLENGVLPHIAPIAFKKLWFPKSSLKSHAEFLGQTCRLRISRINFGHDSMDGKVLKCVIEEGSTCLKCVALSVKILVGNISKFWVLIFFSFNTDVWLADYFAFIRAIFEFPGKKKEITAFDEGIFMKRRVLLQRFTNLFARALWPGNVADDIWVRLIFKKIIFISQSKGAKNESLGFDTKSH